MMRLDRRYSRLNRLIEKLRKKWMECRNGIVSTLSQERK
jgi:hypothetical protein